MQIVNRLVSDVIALLFPELCSACGTNLNHSEDQICIKCLHTLPFTDFHTYQDNPVAKQLWGRLPITSAMAMLYFKKGGRVQNLIHGLKYNSKPEIGMKLGNLLAQKLKESDLYQDIDLIIPVPLHSKKHKIRGYNQSECIAIGLSEELKISVDNKHLIKSKSTSSQTKKSRYTRYENMDEVFIVLDPQQLFNLHVLLIDDVVTTGSTLEAGGNALLRCGIKKLSIATIAFAE